jgi:hypothetical protein
VERDEEVKIKSQKHALSLAEGAKVFGTVLETAEVHSRLRRVSFCGPRFGIPNFLH